MATSDLLAELGKDGFKAEAEMERKLCTAVLNQLEDPSGDISGLAVKWCAHTTCIFFCCVLQAQLQALNIT